MTASPTIPRKIRLLRAALGTSAAAVALALPALTPAASHASDDQAASAASIMARPCFGAAARNPFGPCVDPDLRRTIVPSPDDAVLEPNAPCQPQADGELVNPCLFGASSSAKPATVALIGDSHASHWRAAIDVVARATGSRAVSITRSGCPFSEARVVVPVADQAAVCQRWNRAVLAWLQRHDEVTTVFVSQRANATYVAPRAGASNFDTAVRGDAARYRALPASVKSVVVVRDTPLSSGEAGECVRRAYARNEPAAMRCARARSKALRPDPAVSAARQLRGRVHVLDMTRFFCSDARCYPVIGGALVHKDVDHITAVFARTLGPFMVGKVASIVYGAAKL